MLGWSHRYDRLCRCPNSAGSDFSWFLPRSLRHLEQREREKGVSSSSSTVQLLGATNRVGDVHFSHFCEVPDPRWQHGQSVVPQIPAPPAAAAGAEKISRVSTAVQ